MARSGYWRTTPPRGQPGPPRTACAVETWRPTPAVLPRAPTLTLWLDPARVHLPHAWSGCNRCSRLCRTLHHILQGFHQETYANTSGAFRNIRPILTRPRRASNIQVHPGGITHKFLEERAAYNRASLTPAAHIFNIGKIALNLFAVLLKQG